MDWPHLLLHPVEEEELCMCEGEGDVRESGM